VKNEALAEKFAELSTPLVFDAALRLKIPVRIAPAAIAPVIPALAPPAVSSRRNISAASMSFSKRWKPRSPAMFS
jgi:hypothetical protein